VARVKTSIPEDVRRACEELGLDWAELPSK
jgi:hypothetical protein